MGKLTDESVAKALGWKKTQTKGFIVDVWHSPNVEAHKRHADASINNRLPRFTTSLDAIIAEVEARGLAWNVGGGKKSPHYLAWVQEYGCNKPLSWGDQITAPLALCAALLAHLKEERRAD